MKVIYSGLVYRTAKPLHGVQNCSSWKHLRRESSGYDRLCAGNNWGRDVNGTACLGCGAQEEFYGCADIAIVNSTHHPRSSVDQLHATQTPVTRPHRTIGSPLQTTVYPLHVQGASSAGTTTTTAADRLAKQLGDRSQTVGPKATTASSSALLPTKQVVQFGGQPYDVVVHSSVFCSLLFSFMCYFKRL